ncbi:MAG: type II toxin-antitoxin system HicB family antitoxin [Candidatus Omnitrophota bacterium]|jgi:predicted HicB family RNase H-like nuclease|nr:MAG: type II toxin-antitoxin system HicB family antitoxin [Candidatus Omnitrophota bacterium]
MMEYKGYTGIVEYDEDAEIFHGHVIGIRGAITFEADLENDLEQAFHDSVEDYLEFCEELGREPEKPFGGTFRVEVSPDLHKKAWKAADAAGKDLNHWLNEVLEKELSTSVTD